MYLFGMDALDLYVLSRRLGKIGEAAMRGPGAEGLSPAVALVLGEVLSRPGSSIREITERTGYPQSYVSKSVDRLRAGGVVETFADPQDGRRTLVRPTEAVGRRIAGRASAPYERLLAEAVGTDALPEVTAALEILVRHLVPKTARP
jgi:DNA-binding MarR family transcriptional regulator